MAHPETLRTYRGNCHCKTFVYEVQLPEIKSAFQCNCSICHKKGYLWAIPASKGAVEFVKGDTETLTKYTFNDRKYVHKFCETCATPLMAESEDRIALNVHAMQGINSWDLEKKPVGVPYQVPEHKGPLPTAKVEGGRLYNGGCHCGAVTVALTSLPLDGTNDETGLECDCSICERNAYVWTYPKNEQVVLHAADPDNIGRYRFSTMMLNKTFCKICGVNLTNELNRAVTAEEKAQWSGGMMQFEKYAEMHNPVNLRVLPGVDVTKLEIRKSSLDLEPRYQNP